MPDPHQRIENFHTKGEFGRLMKTGAFPILQPRIPDQAGLKPIYSKAEQIKRLTDRVDALERLIRITFNGHVLIDGQFVKVTV